MMRFLKSLSRKVHEEPEAVNQDYCCEGSGSGSGGGAWVSLTVWRKSLCVGCEGFTVINSDGDLVYRVDNYPGYLNEILLMDGSGNPILTISRRKLKLGLVDNWLVSEGEDAGNNTTTLSNKAQLNKPICYARKSANNISQPKTSILARLYQDKSNTSCRYVIEGSYEHRSCKVFDELRRLVAEIRKKEAKLEGISFGLDVFVLKVRPGFSSGFAMGIVLLLDQMFS